MFPTARNNKVRWLYRQTGDLYKAPSIYLSFLSLKSCLFLVCLPFSFDSFKIIETSLYPPTSLCPFLSVCCSLCLFLISDFTLSHSSFKVIRGKTSSQLQTVVSIKITSSFLTYQNNNLCIPLFLSSEVVLCFPKSFKKHKKIARSASLPVVLN